MAYKQTPGRSPFLKTGRDIPLNMTSPLHQQGVLSQIGSGIKHGWEELKSLGRRIGTYGPDSGVTPPKGQESFGGNYGGSASTKMEQREFDYQYNKKKAAEEAAKKVSGTSGATKGM